MIIPIRCFSCNNIIADKFLKYEKLINEKKKDKNFDEQTTDNQDIFRKLKLKRYCCRRMLLTNVELINKIK